MGETSNHRNLTTTPIIYSQSSNQTQFRLNRINKNQILFYSKDL